MKLCLAFGCTLAELDDRMTMKEFRLWAEMYQREPWGDARADLRTASLTAVMANCHSLKRMYKTSDFLPDWERQYRPKPEATAEEIQRRCMRFAIAFGGTVQ